jgi:hypothetical protein
VLAGAGVFFLVVQGVRNGLHVEPTSAMLSKRY